MNVEYVSINFTFVQASFLYADSDHFHVSVDQISV